MFYRTVNLGTISYQAGQKKTLDIDRDGVLVRLNIRTQFTITNSATPPVAPKFEALARLIRRVDFVVAGRDTIVSQSGEMIAARAHAEFGVAMDGMEDTVVLTASTGTVYDVTLPILLFLPRSRNPIAAAVDLRRVTQATLEITWGSDTDIYGTSNSAVVSAVTCNVEAEYLMDMPGDVPFQVRELKEILQPYTATNNKLAVTIDGSTGLAERSLAIASLVDSIGSNTPLAAGSVKVEAGSLIYHDKLGPAIQAANRSDYELQNPLTGFYFLPLTSFGDLEQAINTDPRVIPADLKAIFDVTFGSGTHELLIGTEAVRPLKIA